ncbi:hypothetical protein NHX12_008047 [Muraenolepis orangiensis]|uniref:Uncharacterized protein n=1 Tax=Muraenolepis orangiensis TaxID=630683 RepID=A0A9Q0DKL1_9TELE|nr:hypothetical protein NHX12_008047 [Muraenolepis orangiensis]
MWRTTDRQLNPTFPLVHAMSSLYRRGPPGGTEAAEERMPPGGTEAAEERMPPGGTEAAVERMPDSLLVILPTV